MDKDRSYLTRRNALKTIGIGGLAAAGLAASSGSAAAATLSFTANNPPVRVFNDGSVSAVTVAASGVLTFEGLDYDATSADIELQAKHPDEGYETATAETIDLVSRKDGQATFSLDPVDLTEDTSFTDEDFSEDTDGELKTTDVPLRLSVTVNTENAGYDVYAEASDTLQVRARNQQKTAGGEASSDTPTTYAGDLYDKNDDDTGEDVYMRIYYGDDEVVYELDVSDVAHRFNGLEYNAALGFDLNEDNIADFQFAWRPFDDNLPYDFAYSDVTSEPAWEKDGSEGWTDAQSLSGVEFSYDVSSYTLQLTLSRDEFGIPDAGETYRVGAQGSSGGEGPYVAVSAEPGKFWSEANNYTSSEHFIQTEAE